MAQTLSNQTGDGVVAPQIQTNIFLPDSNGGNIRIQGTLTLAGVDEITPQAFAHTINAALRDPDTADKARHGIRRAQSHEFSHQQMVDQTLAAYDNALQAAHRDDRR